ncbi:unnamed protein product [Paramecium sonneborni]|uniref:Protein kinase domain-containing protein n=1 Tax=Paramecium sonneborni TaxID=65129 RepID=A0A8S1NLD1_9CILI|nr:unnamed protein product [Paramecium sonneborni]
MNNYQITTSQCSPNNILAVCVVIRRHFFRDRQYYLSLTSNSLTLSDGPNQKSPKYTQLLGLDTVFTWILDQQNIIGFTLPYRGKIKEFYGKQSDMQYLKDKMGQLVIYENINKFYNLEKKTEKGSFGKVMLGICKHTQKQVAVKQLEILKNSQSIIKNEINILRTIYNYLSQNILELKEVYKDKQSYYIVTEYIDGYNLQQLLSIRKTPYSLQESLHIVEQILKGLTQIHQSHVIHRDLKPSNIMYNYNKIKIIDFGLSCFCGKQLNEFPNCGTTGYCAPEVLNAKKTTLSYNYKVDIFSLGCIFYEILTLKKVFPYNKEQSTYYLNQNCLINIEESGQIYDLIKLFLKEDPKQRLDTFQALKLVQNFIEMKNFDVNTWYKISFEKDKQRNNSEEIFSQNLSGLFKF